MKASGTCPRGAGGAFYYDDRAKRVFILEADGVWLMQGLPLELLATWRDSGAADMFSTPASDGAAVKRVGGNSITTGTAGTIARHFLVGRAVVCLTLQPNKRRRAREQPGTPTKLAPRPPSCGANPGGRPPRARLRSPHLRRRGARAAGAGPRPRPGWRAACVW